MPIYRRLAVIVPVEADSFLTAVLPLAEEGQTPELKDLKNVEIYDEKASKLYVLNYTNYYVISPGSFEKHIVPPPPEAMALEDSNTSNLPRYTYDLLPCPKTLQPFTNLAVCVESKYKDAVLLHPERARPSEVEKRVKLEDFGKINLTTASRDGYQWRAWIEPDQGLLSKFIRSRRYLKRFADDHGEYSAGTFKPLD